MDIKEDDQRGKGADYVDKNEGANNFYKDRVKMVDISRSIDPTEQFVFSKVFPPVKEIFPCMFFHFHF